jgi:hypothetical protein
MLEKKQPLQQMVLGKLDIPMWKIETRALSSYTNFNSKWIVNLNVRSETETTTGKIEETLEYKGIGNDFLNRTRIAH